MNKGRGRTGAHRSRRSRAQEQTCRSGTLAMALDTTHLGSALCGARRKARPARGVAAAHHALTPKMHFICLHWAVISLYQNEANEKEISGCYFRDEQHRDRQEKLEANKQSNP